MYQSLLSPLSFPFLLSSSHFYTLPSSPLSPILPLSPSPLPLLPSLSPRQLITNCRSGKADKALSFWFILLWAAGDTTNLLGSILTKQLATQVLNKWSELNGFYYTIAVYCLVTITMVTGFLPSLLRLMKGLGTR